MSEVKETKKSVKANEPKKGKNKKPNAFVRFFKWIGKKAKEMWSELKNVTWPKMPNVVKQTGIVLGVILIFLILVTGIDYGLQALLTLVAPK